MTILQSGLVTRNNSFRLSRASRDTVFSVLTRKQGFGRGLASTRSPPIETKPVVAIPFAWLAALEVRISEGMIGRIRLPLANCLPLALSDKSQTTVPNLQVVLLLHLLLETEDLQA